ncbi:MAG: tRNA 2-thiouridine(34) synthase MnmA [Bacillota bacterium]|jgi:tRNA-specific 2-thiouridylase
MSKGKVMLAMSGGVDSSVSVVLLQEAGYEVEGITMCLGDFSVVEKAAESADHFGIKHHWVDLTEEFDRYVKSYFVEEYKNGRTPNPCVICNKKVKMGRLFAHAETIGFDWFATGHYANVVKTGERYAVKKASYLPKDQSYVLYSLGQEVLSRLILPLGGLSKDEVRAKGRELGLAAAGLKDSQDICFIPDGNYRRFLTERGLENTEGSFVLKDGTVVGRHKGVANYTVGQRKGLGIAMGYPVFVTAIRPETNEVELGLESDLFSDRMLVRDCNYLTVEKLTEPRELDIKIRYKSPAVKGIVNPLPNGQAEVSFLSPEKAVTPGQSAVFYDGDTVVGGGIIVK